MDHSIAFFSKTKLKPKASDVSSGSLENRITLLSQDPSAVVAVRVLYSTTDLGSLLGRHLLGIFGIKGNTRFDVKYIKCDSVIVSTVYYSEAC